MITITAIEPKVKPVNVFSGGSYDFKCMFVVSSDSLTDEIFELGVSINGQAFVTGGHVELISPSPSQIFINNGSELKDKIVFATVRIHDTIGNGDANIYFGNVYGRLAGDAMDGILTFPITSLEAGSSFKIVNFGKVKRIHLDEATGEHIVYWFDSFVENVSVTVPVSAENMLSLTSQGNVKLGGVSNTNTEIEVARGDFLRIYSKTPSAPDPAGKIWFGYSYSSDGDYALEVHGASVQQGFRCGADEGFTALAVVRSGNSTASGKLLTIEADGMSSFKTYVGTDINENISLVAGVGNETVWPDRVTTVVIQSDSQDQGVLIMPDLSSYKGMHLRVIVLSTVGDSLIRPTAGHTINFSTSDLVLSSDVWVDFVLSAGGTNWHARTY